MAELKALHSGLVICMERGFDKIWIEVDATSILSLLSSPHPGCWRFQQILHKIKEIMNHMDIKITHIYREANRAADLLATQACHSHSPAIFSKDHLHGQLKGIVRLDSMSYPYFRF